MMFCSKNTRRAEHYFFQKEKRMHVKAERSIIGRFLLTNQQMQSIILHLSKSFFQGKSSFVFFFAQMQVCRMIRLALCRYILMYYFIVHWASGQVWPGCVLPLMYFAVNYVMSHSNSLLVLFRCFYIFSSFICGEI